MAETKPKQSAPVLKSRFGKTLGFRTPDAFKGKTFSPKGSVGYNPSSFKMTQNKGSGGK
jgi:hypothetical protein